METNREMLEWAAKAADMDWCAYSPDKVDNCRLCLQPNGRVWDPCDDDGDSRRLQIDCGLTLCRFPDAMVAMHSPSGRSWAERHDAHGGDSYAAARLAVLRAAAALGRDMP